MATNTEQYFQSDLLAEEMERRWQGIVQYNDIQSLSEEQKARARRNIGAVPFGSALKVLGRYDTFEDLRSEVVSPTVGDAYSVGIEAPFRLYIYDGISSEWTDYGLIRANDIVTRTLQDVVVHTWKSEEQERQELEEEQEKLDGVDVQIPDYVFPYLRYPWKGIIEIEGITENDFPLIAFDAIDAASGDFCPVAFSFDGRIEIFATKQPEKQITLPVISFIAENRT